MLTRVHIVTVVLMLAVAPCYAGKSLVRDGSTKEKAIALKQRGAKAVEEEMAWMMKLYRYTPLLATRDLAAAGVRQIRADKAKTGKAKTVHLPQPWEHATIEHNGRWCSYWWFWTLHGRKEIYFDTGVAITTPGEVPRQESARAQYMGRMVQTLKIQ